jgi:hypothetical protein
MSIANGRESTLGSAMATNVEIFDDWVYYGFESGQVKALDLHEDKLYEMRGDIGSALISICRANSLLVRRDHNCPKVEHVTDLLFSSSRAGKFVIHCP